MNLQVFVFQEQRLNSHWGTSGHCPLLQMVQLLRELRCKLSQSLCVFSQWHTVCAQVWGFHCCSWPCPSYGKPSVGCGLWSVFSSCTTRAGCTFIYRGDDLTTEAHVPFPGGVIAAVFQQPHALCAQSSVCTCSALSGQEHWLPVGIGISAWNSRLHLSSWGCCNLPAVQSRAVRISRLGRVLVFLCFLLLGDSVP